MDQYLVEHTQEFVGGNPEFMPPRLRKPGSSSSSDGHTDGSRFEESMVQPVDGWIPRDVVIGELESLTYYAECHVT
jgi:hypothetical protein